MTFITMISTVAIQASPFSLPVPDVLLLLPREQRPSISSISISSISTLQLHALAGFVGKAGRHRVGGEQLSVAALAPDSPQDTLQLAVVTVCHIAGAIANHRITITRSTCIDAVFDTFRWTAPATIIMTTTHHLLHLAPRVFIAIRKETIEGLARFLTRWSRIDFFLNHVETCQARRFVRTFRLWQAFR